MTMQDLRDILILILILVIVRWAVHSFLPVFGGLGDTICDIVFVLGVLRVLKLIN